MTPRDAGRSGLPKAVRLLRPAEFKRVYDLRQSGAAGPLVIYAAPNDLSDRRVRLGLSVSRRVGKAVVRNRWKRRLREAFRAIRQALPAGNDYVVVVRGGEPPPGAEGMRRTSESMLHLARRITGRRGYGAGGDAAPTPRPGR